jgi:PspA-Associated protein
MIVRISTEGQYEVSDGDTAGLNELDNEAVSAGEAGDEASFRDVFGRLLDYVRSNGRPVPDDELVGSDIILPPPDVSLQEAQSEFQGEGLIPG